MSFGIPAKQSINVSVLITRPLSNVTRHKCSFNFENYV